MLTFPNAKINLGLHIIEKRTDGFHNIETVFYPIRLKDALEFVENKTDEKTILQLSGIEVDSEINNNLILKAYRLLAVDFPLPPLSVYLRKNIPLGAGLGGGSADAAFMLMMINQNFKLNLSENELCAYAARLGSDCTFFIENKPAFASGRGEILEEVNISLKGYHLVLVKPNVHVSTADAYLGCKPQIPAFSLKEIIRQPIEMWHKNMKNDFEETVFRTHPIIGEIKTELYRCGALYAAMSGSGASVFGIFQNKTALKKQFENCFVWEEELS